MSVDLQGLYSFLEQLLRLSAMIAGIALIWKRDLRSIPVEMVAFCSIAVLALNFSLLFSAMGIDFGFFRAVGLDVRRGLDPYATPRFGEHPFLNPPTALPIFAVFTLAPFRIGMACWAGLNLLALIGLPAYARHVLTLQARAFDGSAGEPLADRVVIGLTIALLISDSALVGVYLGQLAIFTTLLLVAALHAQAKGRAVLAGICLAMATVKVSTMLPFLLLFRRRKDLATWISLGLTSLLLCVSAGAPRSLPGQLRTLAGRIEEMARPGATNDYSYEGTQNANIVGFDHTLYRLGLRDRGTIRIVQAALILAIGSFVAWKALGGGIPRGASCSLVALFASLFLYHRNYDLVLLVLPMIDCSARARVASGAERRWLATASTAILLALFANVNALTSLTKSAPEWGFPGRIVQAVVLPYSTWMILLAIVGLLMGLRRSPPTARLA